MSKINSKNDLEQEIFLDELVEIIEKYYGEKDGAGSYRDWLTKWMAEPIPALGGEKPNNLSSTEEGREKVKNMLGRAIFSVYS